MSLVVSSHFYSQCIMVWVLDPETFNSKSPYSPELVCNGLEGLNFDPLTLEATTYVNHYGMIFGG